MAKADFIVDNSGRKKIAVETQLREKNLIKQVPGSRWDNELRTWTVNPTYTAAFQLSAVFGRALECSDEVKKFVKGRYALTEWRAECSKLPDCSDDFDHPRIEELSPLQRAGAEFLVDGSTLLADEMGSGKTVQACVALEAGNAESVLIVCPNSVKRVWERHVHEWTTMTPVVVRGSAKDRTAQIELVKEPFERVALIMNWEQLLAHSRLAAYGNIKLSDKERMSKELNGIQFDVIVADEAHRAKNPQAKVTRALWALKGNVRWALTGTPIANHPGDFWSILRFLDPEEWPSKTAYIDRYCQQQWNAFGGTDIIGIRSDTRDEFYHLVDRYFIRRTRAQIMGREIKRKHVERIVTLPPKHRKMYDQFKKELLLILDGGEDAISATNQLAATTRLTQLCASYLEYDEDTGKYRMCSPSPKVDELVQVLEDLGDEPVVVYSSSKQLVRLVAEKLEKERISHWIATGDVPADERNDAAERWQAGERRVFVATTQAMAEGITLTRAKTMIHIHRSWSMIKNKQADDRIDRWGQESDEVTYIEIIAEDTIDERVIEVFGDKQVRLSEITRDKLRELV